MRFSQWLLVVIVAVGLNPSAHAGIFSRKPKADPAETVPALIMQLKTDKDDGKRQTAAEELRNYDPKAFPEIMTVLIDALTKDTATGVRLEAASSIAKLSPINQQAGFALEQAASNDPSIRVRMSARQSLWQYHLKGYRSGKQPEQAGPSLTPGKGGHTTAKPHGESAEPPLAEPLPSPGTPSTSQKPSQSAPSAPPRIIPPLKQAPKTNEPQGPALSPN
ncbi:MAG: HEAT repeat domain-containing protein [Gemmataceae bacterium]